MTILLRVLPVISFILILSSCGSADEYSPGNESDEASLPTGQEHRLTAVWDHGKYLLLDDGAIWESQDEYVTSDWSSGDDVIESGSEMVNTDDPEESASMDNTGVTERQAVTIKQICGDGRFFVLSDGTVYRSKSPINPHWSSGDRVVFIPDITDGTLLNLDDTDETREASRCNELNGYSYRSLDSVAESRYEGLKKVVRLKSGDAYRLDSSVGYISQGDPVALFSSPYGSLMLVVEDSVCSAVPVAYEDGAVNQGSHVVDSYFKKNGTRVDSYHRTNPNGTTLDNYSTEGNENPWTGQPGTVVP